MWLLIILLSGDIETAQFDTKLQCEVARDAVVQLATARKKLGSISVVCVETGKI